MSSTVVVEGRELARLKELEAKQERKRAQARERQRRKRERDKQRKKLLVLKKAAESDDSGEAKRKPAYSSSRSSHPQTDQSDAKGSTEELLTAPMPQGGAADVFASLPPPEDPAEAPGMAPPPTDPEHPPVDESTVQMVGMVAGTLASLCLADIEKSGVVPAELQAFWGAGSGAATEVFKRAWENIARKHLPGAALPYADEVIGIGGAAAIAAWYQARWKAKTAANDNAPPGVIDLPTGAAANDQAQVDDPFEPMPEPEPEPAPKENDHGTAGPANGLAGIFGDG